VTVGVCTDSGALLPPDVVQHYGIEVVPLTVRVGEEEFLDGVDIDAEAFYERFAATALSVTTSAPSSGQFVLAYERLIERGATEILSIHTAQASPVALQPGHQPTLTAALLAARACDVPVRVVGPDTSGFGVGCCAWAAAEAIGCGQSLDAAALRAEQLVGEIGQVTFTDDGSVDELADLLAGRDRQVHVAIGLADRVSRQLLEALESALRAARNVQDVIRFRVGPSAGAVIGPGSAVAFAFPI
jgi:fatty acid-binding protein DegV